MNERIVAERLLQHAANYAARRGYAFGDGVEATLPRLAEAMAQRVLDRAAAEDGPPERYVRMAEGNVSIFIDAMIDAALHEPRYLAERGSVIGELTWARAQSALCPIWPIC